MEYKRPFLFCFRIFIDFCFLSILFYWTFMAIYKYSIQPISTHTTYTKGDNDQYITFPHISFCRIMPMELNGFRKSPDDDFATLLQRHLIYNSNFDADDYLKNSTIHIQDFIYRAVLKVSSEKPMNDVTNLFYQKYHPKHGACVVFDGQGAEIPISEATEDTQLYFEWKTSALGFAYIDLITFHSKYDGSDAFLPTIRHSRNIRFPLNYFVKLKKKINTRESTRMSPCGEFSQETCQEVQGNQMIADSLGCKVPLLFTEQYLEESIENYNALPNCDSNALVEALDIFKNMSKECEQERACKKVKITQTFELEFGGQPTNDPIHTLQVQFSDFEVEHDISSINYDLQSMICEVGGVLGMTLGFSGLSIGHAVVNFFKRC